MKYEDVLPTTTVVKGDDFQAGYQDVPITYPSPVPSSCTYNLSPGEQFVVPKVEPPSTPPTNYNPCITTSPCSQEMPTIQPAVSSPPLNISPPSCILSPSCSTDLPTSYNNNLSPPYHASSPCHPSSSYHASSPCPTPGEYHQTPSSGHYTFSSYSSFPTCNSYLPAFPLTKAEPTQMLPTNQCKVEPPCGVVPCGIAPSWPHDVTGSSPGGGIVQQCGVFGQSATVERLNELLEEGDMDKLTGFVWSLPPPSHLDDETIIRARVYVTFYTHQFQQVGHWLL